MKDELDELLREEDRRIADEAKRAGVQQGKMYDFTEEPSELNVRRPLKGIWETDVEYEGGDDYQMHKTLMEQCLDKLERLLAEQRRHYDDVAIQKKQDKEAMIMDWMWLCVYVLLLAILQYFWNSGNALSQMAAILLVVFWAGGFVKYVKHNVSQTFRYAVRCNAKHVNAYVEARRIATYAKQEEYYIDCIRKAKEHLDMAKRLDARLEKAGRLTENEQQMLADAMALHLNPISYDNETIFTLDDWLAFRFKKK